MPIAIDPTERTEYILENERGEENPTKFFFQAPTSSKKNRIKGKFINLLQQQGIKNLEEEELPYEIAIEYSLIVLEEIMVGWENFLDSEGRKVPFKTVNLRANIDRVSPKDQEEIAAEAQRIAGFTGEEEKNSDGPSS